MSMQVVAGRVTAYKGRARWCMVSRVYGKTVRVAGRATESFCKQGWARKHVMIGKIRLKQQRTGPDCTQVHATEHTRTGEGRAGKVKLV